MKESEKAKRGKTKITEVKTFSVPSPLGEIREDIIVNTNTIHLKKYKKKFQI